MKPRFVETIFISDLHLHPANQSIAQQFDAFLEWIPDTVKNLYILGDFVHVWVGDDALDLWSAELALKIKALKTKGIQVYFLAGNRDFLLGKRFAEYAGWTILPDPTLIQCGERPVLITHGDSYCTKDRGHQRLRKITRNALFCTIFNHMPLIWRLSLAKKMRQQSKQAKPLKTLDIMDVVKEDVLADMQAHQVFTVIHGHTHKPGLSEYEENGLVYKRYVLSDWDDRATFLCYDKSLGFYFDQVE